MQQLNLQLTRISVSHEYNQRTVWDSITEDGHFALWAVAQWQITDWRGRNSQVKSQKRLAVLTWHLRSAFPPPV